MRLRFIHLPLCCINLLVMKVCHLNTLKFLYGLNCWFIAMWQRACPVHRVWAVHVLWAVNATSKNRSEQDRQKCIISDFPYFPRFSWSSVFAGKNLNAWSPTIISLKILVSRFYYFLLPAKQRQLANDQCSFSLLLLLLVTRLAFALRSFVFARRPFAGSCFAQFGLVHVVIVSTKGVPSIIMVF